MVTSRFRHVAAVLLGAVVPAVLLAACVIPPLVLWSRLPEPVADHWSFGAVPNGSKPKLVAFGIPLGLALAGAGLLVSWARRSRKATPGDRRRDTGSMGALATGLALAGVGASSSLEVALVNLDLRRWQDARAGAPHLLVLVLGPLALAAAGTFVARRTGIPASPPEAPGTGLGLGDHERAFWLGSARSNRAALLAVAGLAGSVALGLTAGWRAVPALAVPAVAILWLSTISVSASAEGVTVRYGPFRWPATRIPLRRIVRAEAIDVAPRSWGYRGSLHIVGAAALIVRKGPALRLDLQANKRFLVTVDDAATGAALLNDELTRQTKVSSQ
jgi:hypothetical protein